MPLRTRIYVVLTLLAAAGAVYWSVQFAGHSWLLFGLFSVIVLLSSGFKVALPRGDGGMSLNFPFILLAIVQLSPGQAILLAAISMAAQCRLKVKKLLTAIQIVFNIASTVTATGAACATYLLLTRLSMPLAPALALAAVAYFFCSTGSVALVIASSTGEPPLRLWKKEFPWYLPFYFVGAVLAAGTSLIAGRYGWFTSLLMVPMVYTVYRAYNGQMAMLKERAQHLEETQALHHRTIEGLSMAIEAKDQNTHDHLFRVRDYVEELGRNLALSAGDMQALHTASFLHDIGKLAVPEHIINKPGKLTPEEFEKMKIHPVVGADILERVRFPYPVVPIVRSHHEWWDGSGYPDGLKGEEIPIGARVLSVADCFDALISDRPYRKGLAIAEALASVKKMSGIQFDPQVVTVLEALYARLSQEERHPDSRTFMALNTEVEVWRGEAPAAGFESAQPASSLDEAGSHAARASRSMESANLIAVASQEAQSLFELTESLGASLSRNEILSIIASRLHRLIPFDSCALYLRAGDDLTLRYIDGEQARSFSREPVALGEGISGWVAQSGKPILNGSATLERSYRNQSGRAGELRAALSIPLFDLDMQVFAVLTLYAVAADSFERDHLRILLTMRAKLALSIQNSLQVRLAENHAEIDFLTGLPNARRLFLQLETELEQCRRSGASMALIVCDVNRLEEIHAQRGHDAADRALSIVAESLQRNCIAGDWVARLGGDEFVFLLREGNEQRLAERIAEIGETVAAAGRHLAVSFAISASLGMALYPGDGVTPEELLAVAGRRMRLDKRLEKQRGRERGEPANGEPVVAIDSWRSAGGTANQTARAV